MEIMTLVLLLLIAVLLSAVVDQLLPRTSLPLIQVALGVIISFFAGSNLDINLDPNLFLVLFIAPLLYIEAKDADKQLLWKSRRPILSLAIGLVVVTMLIIGFVLNVIAPSIPLAAAFALGAALGPTDAVAVTSLSKRIKLASRQWGILKGELLLNDASGIVSFQFAIAAAVTGTFSVIEAAEDFLLEFVGGLVVGIVLGYLANFIVRKIRSIGIESTTFHVLYEICIPFVVYLISTSLHVSGIIAVVVAGLFNVISPRTASPTIAHMNIVSSNVWDVISFALNGIVFVLLGTQLIDSMRYTWQDASIDNLTLVGLILVVSILLYAVRFIWCLSMEAIQVRYGLRTRFNKTHFRDALVTTLCGAKGTITLSILFTIPIYMSGSGTVFPSRRLIIFLGCGVILVTLLVATFIVPLIAPKREAKPSEQEEKENYFQVLSDVFRNVIEQLAAMQDSENSRATATVIQNYQKRLENTLDEINEETPDNLSLRLDALDWSRQYTLELIEDGTVSHDIGYEYLDRLDRIRSYLTHKGSSISVKRIASSIRVAFVQFCDKVFGNIPSMPAMRRSTRRNSMNVLHQMNLEYVIGRLRTLVVEGEEPTEIVSKLLLRYGNMLEAARRESMSVTTTLGFSNKVDDMQRVAYQIELEEIQKMYEEDRISRSESRRMRDNVYVMQMDLEDRL